MKSSEAFERGPGAGCHHLPGDMKILDWKKKAGQCWLFLARYAMWVLAMFVIIVFFNPVTLPITMLAATLGIEVSVLNAVLALGTILVVKHALRVRSMVSHIWLFTDIAVVAQLSLSIDLNDLRRPLIRPCVILFFAILWLVLGAKCSAASLILFGFADYVIWKQFIADTINMDAVELCALYMGVLPIWFVLAYAMLRNANMVRLHRKLNS